jgi:hypothetical protein
MSRNVKVSVIGTMPPDLPQGLEGQGRVDYMINFWRRHIEEVLPDKPDLIALPEMCDRFRAMSLPERWKYYEVRGDQILDYFREVARTNNCYFIYPTARPAENGTWRNAAVMIDRQGEVMGTYHKNHIVVTETYNSNILCGRDAPVFECDFGTVAIAICFDLNFEEIRLKYAAVSPDIIVFPSNYHGGFMQAYWAYTCRAHFIAALGNNNLLSSITSPVGNVLASTTNYFPHLTKTINLDCCVVHLDFNWDRIRALKEKYGPQVEIFDPGLVGALLLTSESPEVTALEMVKEFEIELLDDYFERSMAHRRDESNMEPEPELVTH